MPEANPGSARAAMAAGDAVFGALADATRRRLLSSLVDQPATATELAGELPISRQAVLKHLNALADAGLVSRERSGREVRYSLTPAPLSDAASWIAAVGAQWDERLAVLAKSFHSRSPGEAGRGVPRARGRLAADAEGPRAPGA